MDRYLVVTRKTADFWCFCLILLMVRIFPKSVRNNNEHRSGRQLKFAPRRFSSFGHATDVDSAIAMQNPSQKFYGWCANLIIRLA